MTTVLISVNTPDERDKLIDRIYTNLTTEPSTTFTVRKPQINKLEIYHNIDNGNNVLIRVYLVVILPIILNLSPLDSVSGEVEFKLEETINKLQALTRKLQSLNGRRKVKESNNGETLRRLVESLC